MSDFFKGAPVDPLGETTNRDKTVFIWIDILGFSNEVDNDVNYGLLQGVLKSFRDTFELNSEYGVTPISDGLVIDIPQEIHKGDYDIIISLFQQIGKLQFEFTMKNDYCTRGGIAVGTKNEDPEIPKERSFEKVLISNGLARSHKVESKYV